MVEKDLPVEIGFGEAVRARIEFFAIARRLDAERIELGVKMSAHPVGADQHQRAHRIARGLMHVGGGEFARPRPAPWPRVFLPTAFSTSAQLPSSAEVRSSRGVTGQLALPHEGPSAFLRTSAGRIFQAFEELLPLGVDRGGIVLVAGVDFVDVGGVCALQKRGKGKCSVRILARHGSVLIIFVIARGKRRGSRSASSGSAGSEPLPYLGRNFAPKRTKE